MVIGNERMLVHVMGWDGGKKGGRKLGLIIELERESRDSRHEWNMKYKKEKGQESRIQKYSISE